MSSLPLAQRRHVDVDHVEAVEEVLAELARGDRLRRGPCWSRRGAARPPACGCSRRRPAGSRRSRGSGGASPASAGSSRRPRRGRRCRCARAQLADLVAVRVGERAAGVSEQLRLEERLGQRRRSSPRRTAPRSGSSASGCAGRSRSLPTPLSPVMSTFASPAATRSASAQMARSASERPMIGGLPRRDSARGVVALGAVISFPGGLHDTRRRAAGGDGAPVFLGYRRERCANLAPR